MKRLTKAGLAFAALIALGSSIAIADRLNTPVKIGQGSAVTEQLTFDIGSGSANPVVGVTSGGVVRFSNDGVNYVITPTASDTMCVLAASQTLTNKTMLDGSTTIANTSDATKKYVWSLASATTGTTMTLASPQTANRTLTLPDATDTITANAAAQTLSNKTIGSTNTLTGARMASFTPDGTHTLTAPAATDTIAAIAATQTFSNKQFSDAVTISGVATLSGGATISETARVTGSHATGNGTQFDIYNSNTTQDFIIQGGTGNNSPLINVASNDDFLLETNSVEHVRIKGVSTGEVDIKGSAATGTGTVFQIQNTNTGSNLYMKSGSGNDSPTIGATSNDDLVMLANNAERMRLKGVGGVNITGTGGNTPHICVVRSASVNNTSAAELVNCSAGEVATGGGCSAGASVTMTNTSPNVSSGTPSGWTCNWSGSTNTTYAAYAICCQQ